MPSWRESSITLFEEDIHPVELGIQQGVAVEASSSTALTARVHVSNFF
jgi:hypothetical protein